MLTSAPREQSIETSEVVLHDDSPTVQTRVWVDEHDWLHELFKAPRSNLIARSLRVRDGALLS